MPIPDTEAGSLPALPAKFLLSSVLVTELPEPEDVEVGGLGGWGTACNYNESKSKYGGLFQKISMV